ncbi:MAG: IPT/TIG domain-containing protein [Treponema sp.]|nr:IPT/TIG domain-containing protein [Treponema sp.]
MFSILFNFHVKKIPEIYSINPPVGAPGDLIIITGKDFGSIRDTSYIEFGGSKLTSSSYLSWTETEIKVVLPANIKDGLVVVETKDGRSKPAFFANTTAAPVAVNQNLQSNLPLITSITPDKIYPGTLISIKGVNFGNSRERSKVFFSTDREIKEEEKNTNPVNDELNFIEASEDDYNYVYWNDSEIKLYVPDGASSGFVYVETQKGKSTKRKFFIDSKAGKKSFISPRTFLVQTSVDIDETNGDKDSDIILRSPRPFITPSQPLVQMTEYSQEPVISDFQHTIIHQTTGAKSPLGKRTFQQSFAITVYETRTQITAAKLNLSEPINETLINLYTKADACVPSDNEDVIALAKKVIGKEKNPYNQAVLLYNYMIQNYSIANNKKRSDKSPVELIKSKNGDAYDFAMIYTALLRACGIPAIPDSGLIVNSDMKTQNHWWSEFYLASFGWVPVDPALGAGMPFQSWQKDIEASQFYFGNMDGQHIIFSRGWNEIKPSAPNNKIVHRQKSYALQSIWEEASGKTIKYSSYWSNPLVVGIY